MKKKSETKNKNAWTSVLSSLRENLSITKKATLLFDDIADELQVQILSELDLKSIQNCKKVSKSWFEKVKDSYLWSLKYKKLFGKNPPRNMALEAIKQEIFIESHPKYLSLHLPYEVPFCLSQVEKLAQVEKLENLNNVVGVPISIVYSDTSEDFSLCDEVLQERMPRCSLFTHGYGYDPNSNYNEKNTFLDLYKIKNSNTKTPSLLIKIHYATHLTSDPPDSTYMVNSTRLDNFYEMNEITAQLVMADLSDPNVLKRLHKIEKDTDLYRKNPSSHKFPAILAGILPPTNKNKKRMFDKKTLFEHALKNGFDKYIEWEINDETREKFFYTLDKVFIHESIKLNNIKLPIPELAIESQESEERSCRFSCITM